MLKWLKRLLLLAVLAVFLFSAGRLLYKWYEDKQGEQDYQAAVEQFTGAAVPAPAPADAGDAGAEPEVETAPITVDFAALHAVNEDVVAWLYCPDTVISYPVLLGDDNDQYLRHLYDGNYNTAGSIFMDFENHGDFSDTNTILYGHNMSNGSMFGSLANWQEQAYYDEHPVMWLLTPDQDYRIDLLAGYYTSAWSDAYNLFFGYGQPLNDYIAAAMAQSMFKSTAQPQSSSRFVMFSTCADTELVNDERFVVHGMLVPVGRGGAA